MQFLPERLLELSQVTPTCGQISLNVSKFFLIGLLLLVSTLGILFIINVKTFGVFDENLSSLFRRSQLSNMHLLFVFFGYDFWQRHIVFLIHWLFAADIWRWLGSCWWRHFWGWFFLRTLNLFLKICFNAVEVFLWKRLLMLLCGWLLLVQKGYFLWVWSIWNLLGYKIFVSL